MVRVLAITFLEAKAISVIERLEGRDVLGRKKLDTKL